MSISEEKKKTNNTLPEASDPDENEGEIADDAVQDVSGGRDYSFEIKVGLGIPEEPYQKIDPQVKSPLSSPKPLPPKK